VISFLQGVLTAKYHDRVEVDVDGVGYEAFVSQKTLQDAPAVGQAVLIKTYLHVREDVLQLFGFLRDQEKQAFLLLISVSGIGPKAALNVLSAFSAESLYQCILHNDLTSLKSAPGIGQKTAQHMVLELRDKVSKLVGAGAVPEMEGLTAETKNLSDSVQALMGLGYSAAESRRAALTAAQTLGEKPTVEDILRLSLKSMSV
jgi:Holliday junction DNA helicase RuvA